MKSLLPVLALALIIITTCFFEHIIKSAPALDKITVTGGIYAPSAKYGFEPYVYQGVAYTTGCKVLLNESTYPEYTTGVSREKVCVFKTRSELIHLLSINEQPSVLIISHGYDRNDGRWFLLMEGSPDIQVDELPSYHEGIIGVNACRTQVDTSTSWTFTKGLPVGGASGGIGSSDSDEEEGLWYHTRYTHLSTVVVYEPNFRILSYTPFGHSLSSDNESPVITLDHYFK